jgi:hypothetical protein
MCDGWGFTDSPELFYNSRMLGISDGPRDAKFYDLPGYPLLATSIDGMNDLQWLNTTHYYNFGTLALDGHLYQYMSTFNRPFRTDELQKPDFTNPVRFNGAKLIYSPDQGRTWHNQDGSTPVVWEDWTKRSRETLVFLEEDQEALSLLTVLQMGKNYAHNRDGFIYVYAPNGITDGTMNELVMFRVPKRQILDRGAYEYFAGLRADGNATWSKDTQSRKPVHTFPRGWVNTMVHPYAWHPSVVYNAPLGLYMMANWGMGTGTAEIDPFSGVKVDSAWFAKPSYLGFWVAQNPWGPWEQIHEETAWMPEADAAARAYEPQIAPKWIAPDGKSFWLVWTDFQIKGSKQDQRRPYYAFNTQRVDLILT